QGGAGKDLLINDKVAFEMQPKALAAVLAEWTSARSYESRIANLSGNPGGPDFGSRLNGDVFLTSGVQGATVWGDHTADSISGASERDWFFANLDLDSMLGKQAQEYVTDIPSDAMGVLFSPLS